jgi:hypothetical protein
MDMLLQSIKEKEGLNVKLGSGSSHGRPYAKIDYKKTYKAFCDKNEVISLRLDFRKLKNEYLPCLILKQWAEVQKESKEIQAIKIKRRDLLRARAKKVIKKGY